MVQQPLPGYWRRFRHILGVRIQDEGREIMGGAGGGAGGGIGWVGHGKGIVAAFLARSRTREATLDALEADMRERGLPIPPRPMSQEKIFWIGFFSGLLLGLLIGLIFWELT
jgi:hypothetical protein